MKSTYETMGGEYRQDGDYMMPNLEVPESPKLGVWGERRRNYLREHQKARYTAMMLSDFDLSYQQKQKRIAGGLNHRRSPF